MNANINESLEDLRTRLEIDALTEDEIYPVLAAAMEDCGVENLAPSLDALIEQAAELVEKGPPPAASSKSAKAKKGMKMVFGVLRRVAHPIVKVGAWGLGRALQGVGHVAKELGKGLGDKGAQMNWQPKKKRPA